MKRLRPYLVCVAGVVILIGALTLLPAFLLGPVHDFIGLRNTVYSPRFTPERYAQITVGTPRATVADLLGTRLQATTITNYPVWALQDEGVRRHYGTNAELEIESLTFSRSKRSGDYDLVYVWIGPDSRVIEYGRGVTD